MIKTLLFSLYLPLNVVDHFVPV